jgi:hypothetical protein
VIDLDAIGRDLGAAYARRLERRRRCRRIARTSAVAAIAACAFATIAVASGIGPDLELNPAEWSILGRGSTDGGRGEYVHARRVRDGSPSTFMVEHDAGLAPYAAFLLHERTKAAADATSPVPVRPEPGPLCTPAQLTRAESTALTALRAGGDAAGAVEAAFADAPCRGLEWAAERARAVVAGKEPPSMLMPGAR